MTRQLISTKKQPLLRHLTRSVRRAGGFVQVFLPEATGITSHKPITDPHVRIWITSSLRTARELKHVHGEVAARLAEHLGEGGLTKGDLGCAPTDTPRPSQQACLPST